MHLARAFLAVIILSISGCAGRYSNSLQFNPTNPLRVAVLPFAEVDDKGSFTSSDTKLAIDKTLISDELKGTPSQYVQKLVERKLAKTNLDLVSPALVAAQLSHNGFLLPDPKAGFDYSRIFSADKRELCKLLACDALLYGKVTEWDRAYLAIQSISTVGIDLKLYAMEGDLLFSLQGEDSSGRGLSKGPTGFSDLVIEPIKGLSNDVITSLADDVVERTLSPLYVENRPEFLNSEPPSIFASAHDAPSGQIDRKRYLTVVAYGSANKSAFFSIGDTILNVPLIERDKGHYIGEYYPLASDRFSDLPVFVHLEDPSGKTTRQQVGTSTVSLK